VLIATTNPGKMREIAGILEHVPIELVSLDDFPALGEPEETGATFAENARLKALYYNEASGLPSVAEDSGLEIAALGGAPGVHSARWEGRDYTLKFRRIYELLDMRNARGSPARFVCRVALADSSRIVFESEGVVDGRIADEPRGEKGFGYDPIFYYPPLGRTTAELDQDLKATVSHRGQAFAELRTYLQSDAALRGAKARP
jgi:XTP/dITP diphosphohydrolase